MTLNKDFKRLVRSRMAKTGERFTTARLHLSGDVGKSGSGEDLPRIPTSPLPDYASLAGMSDAKVKAATGCPWERWVKALDKVGAHEWEHRAIVAYAQEKFKTPDWWAQMVVVGYERIKGLRAIGQRRGGGYEASKSKTIAVPVTKLFGAWSNARTRAKWLPGVKMKIRRAQENKSLRITWPDGTNVEAGFYPKGAGKSYVALTHTKLVDKADADARKAFWSERFTALAELLA